MSMMLNGGSKNAPALRVYMNLGNLDDLPQESVWFARAGDRDAKLVADGFEGRSAGSIGADVRRRTQELAQDVPSAALR